MTIREKVADRLQGLRIPVLVLAFFMFTTGVALRRILITLFTAKALIAEESEAVVVCGRIYQALPWLLVVAGALIAVTGLIAATRAQRILLGLMACSCLASLVLVEAIYAAGLLFLGYIVKERSLTLNHRGTLPRRIPWTVVVHMFFLFAVGSLLCSGLESAIMVKRFSGTFFPHASFWRYLGLTGALSVAFGLVVALATTLLLQLSFSFFHRVRRRADPGVAVLGLILLHGAAFAGVGIGLARLVFRDDLAALGLTGCVPLLIAPAVFILCILTWVSLCRHSHREAMPLSSVGGIYHHALLALGLFPFLPILGGRGRGLHLALALSGYAATCYVLVYLNYPVIIDYSIRFSLLLSPMLFFLVPAMLFLACRRLGLRPPRIATAAGVVLLLLGMALGLRYYGRQNVRLIAHEYSRIGRTQLFLTNLVAATPPVGFGSDTTFPYFPEDCRTFGEPPATLSDLRTRKPPVFIFLIDGLRPDHTGLGDHHRDTTPNLDALAREGVSFDNAYSCATSTSCGLRHIFTGRYSSRNMLEKEGVDPFWTEDLIDAGYRSFLINTTQTDYNGISLDSFKRNIPPEKIEKASFVDIETYDEPGKVVEALGLLEKLVRQEGRRSGILCYLQASGPHMPWTPAERIYGDDQVALYDACIREADRALGDFLAGLRELGLYRDAIIIVLADHGTGLMDHGRFGGFLTYEEQIRIPLVIRVPGIAPRTVTERVQTIDLGPTLMNLLSDVETNRFHGVSLLGAMHGRPVERRFTFSFSAFEDLVAVTDRGRFKFHYHRSFGYHKLYDLEADPEEMYNLSDRRPDLVREYLDVLDRFLRAGNHSYNNPSHYAPFDPHGR